MNQVVRHEEIAMFVGTGYYEGNDQDEKITAVGLAGTVDAGAGDDDIFAAAFSIDIYTGSGDDKVTGGAAVLDVFDTTGDLDFVGAAGAVTIKKSGSGDVNFTGAGGTVTITLNDTVHTAPGKPMDLYSVLWGAAVQGVANAISAVGDTISVIGDFFGGIGSILGGIGEAGADLIMDVRTHIVTGDFDALQQTTANTFNVQSIIFNNYTKHEETYWEADFTGSGGWIRDNHTSYFSGGLWTRTDRDGVLSNLENTWMSIDEYGIDGARAVQLETLLFGSEFDGNNIRRLESWSIDGYYAGYEAQTYDIRERKRYGNKLPWKTDSKTYTTQTGVDDFYRFYTDRSLYIEEQTAYGADLFAISFLTRDAGQAIFEDAYGKYHNYTSSSGHVVSGELMQWARSTMAFFDNRSHAVYTDSQVYNQMFGSGNGNFAVVSSMLEAIGDIFLSPDVILETALSKLPDYAYEYLLIGEQLYFENAGQPESIQNWFQNDSALSAMDQDVYDAMVARGDASPAQYSELVEGLISTEGFEQSREDYYKDLFRRDLAWFGERTGADLGDALQALGISPIDGDSGKAAEVANGLIQTFEFLNARNIDVDAAKLANIWAQIDPELRADPGSDEHPVQSRFRVFGLNGQTNENPGYRILVEGQVLAEDTFNGVGVAQQNASSSPEGWVYFDWTWHDFAVTLPSGADLSSIEIESTTGGRLFLMEVDHVGIRYDYMASPTEAMEITGTRALDTDSTGNAPPAQTLNMDYMGIRIGGLRTSGADLPEYVVKVSGEIVGHGFVEWADPLSDGSASTYQTVWFGSASPISPSNVTVELLNSTDASGSTVNNLSVDYLIRGTTLYEVSNTPFAGTMNMGSSAVNLQPSSDVWEGVDLAAREAYDHAGDVLDDAERQAQIESWASSAVVDSSKLGASLLALADLLGYGVSGPLTPSSQGTLGRQIVDLSKVSTFNPNGLSQNIASDLGSLQQTGATIHYAAGDGSDLVVAHAGEGEVLVGSDVGERLEGQGDFGSYFFGGDGADTLVGNDGADIFVGGAGDDWIYSDGVAGVNVLIGLAGYDYFVGGAGADIFDGLGDAEQMELFETVDYSAESGTNGISVDLAAGTAFDTFGAEDKLANINHIISTDQADVFVGSGSGDFYSYKGGADTVSGGEGTDTIVFAVDDLPELLKDWNGRVAMITSRARMFGKGSTFDISWFVPAFLKYRGLFGEVLVASFFIQCFGLMIPILFQVVIDKVLVHQSLTTLEVLIFAFICVAVFEALLGYLRTYLFSHTTNRVDVELGARLFDHLSALPISYFENRQVGQTVARVRELENIRNFITGSALTLLIDVSFTFVFFAVMWLFSPTLTLIVLASIPFYVLLAIFITPVLRRRVEDNFQKGAEKQAFLVEGVTAAETIKALSIEPQMQKRWEELLANYVSSSFKTSNLGNFASQATQLISKITSALTLFIGAKLAISGDLTVGQLVAFNMLAGRVTAPILRISQLWNEFQQARISVARLGDILNMPAESGHSAARATLGRLRGEIRFESVTFRYRPDASEVLRGINLTISPGEVVGLVGSSGSGKSTLAKLVQRMYVPQSGRVLVDGTDLANVDTAWLRRQLGVVLQENVLFNRSIADNIAMSNPTIGLDRITEAATLAGAHEFICALPEGYDTMVGERGSTLSGGQRQRIAIARALVTDPQILIFDEATSALDYESEEIIQRNMRRICEGRTVIIVAHRLSAVRNSDAIYTLEKGEIVEMGDHDTLVAANGRYAELYNIQSGEGSFARG